MVENCELRHIVCDAGRLEVDVKLDHGVRGYENTDLVFVMLLHFLVIIMFIARSRSSKSHKVYGFITIMLVFWQYMCVNERQDNGIVRTKDSEKRWRKWMISNAWAQL